MAQQLGYITIGFVDGIGVPASTNIPITADDTKTLATLMAEMLLIANADIALSLDQVTDLRYTFTPANPGPYSPTSGADSTQGLLENFDITGSKYPQEIWTPSLLPALIVNGRIDLTNAALINFTSQLTTLTDVHGTDKQGLAMSGLRDAAKSVRKLKRITTKKTRSIS